MDILIDIEPSMLFYLLSRFGIVLSIELSQSEATPYTNFVRSEFLLAWIKANYDIRFAAALPGPLIEHYRTGSWIHHAVAAPMRLCGLAGRPGN
jgi:hypothetical protein